MSLFGNKDKKTDFRSINTMSFRGCEAADYKVIEHNPDDQEGSPDVTANETPAPILPPPESDNNIPDTDKQKQKKRKIITIILIVVLFLTVFTVLFWLFLKLSFSKVSKYELNSQEIVVNNEDPAISDYTNIALFGVDDQDNVIRKKGSRTDCIMIASIENSTKDIKLLSIYRDTFVSIDGNYDKINAAYSYGGPELAISTINRNLDLNITDFVTVNFKALSDAIDILGGIKLEIKSKKELSNLNDYIINMNHINGGHSKKFKKIGVHLFDGNQAVAYARIRYMEGGDHERANHQRLVVEAILDKAKSRPWKIPSLVNNVLPQCVTSLSSSTLTDMALGLAGSNILASKGYPFNSDDCRYNNIWYGFPLTAKSNAIKAHRYLFGTKNYEPSEELTKISSKIYNVTDYLGLN